MATRNLYIGNDTPSCSAGAFCSGRSAGSSGIDAVQAVYSTQPASGVLSLDITKLESNVVAGNIYSESLGAYTWGAGTYSIPIYVSVADGGTLDEVHVCRVDSSCGAVETLGSVTGLGYSLASSGYKGQADITTVSPSVGSNTDRLAIVLVCSNTGHQNVQNTITFTNSTYYITTPVEEPIEVSPAVYSMSFTGTAPTVELSNHVHIDVTAFNLALSFVAPVASVSQHQYADVPAGSIGISSTAPPVEVTQYQYINSSSFGLSVSGFAPTIDWTNHQEALPSVGSLSLTWGTPSAVTTAGFQRTPASISFTLTFSAPNIRTPKPEWQPAIDLFQSGIGSLFFADPQYLFQDASGDVPVENDGDIVNFWYDASENGNHWVADGSASYDLHYHTDGVHHWVTSNTQRYMVATGIFGGDANQVTIGFAGFVEDSTKLSKSTVGLGSVADLGVPGDRSYLEQIHNQRKLTIGSSTLTPSPLPTAHASYNWYTRISTKDAATDKYGDYVTGLVNFDPTQSYGTADATVDDFYFNGEYNQDLLPAATFAFAINRVISDSERLALEVMGYELYGSGPASLDLTTSWYSPTSFVFDSPVTYPAKFDLSIAWPIPTVESEHTNIGPEKFDLTITGSVPTFGPLTFIAGNYADAYFGLVQDNMTWTGLPATGTYLRGSFWEGAYGHLVASYSSDGGSTQGSLVFYILSYGTVTPYADAVAAAAAAGGDAGLLIESSTGDHFYAPFDSGSDDDATAYGFPAGDTISALQILPPIIPTSTLSFQTGNTYSVRMASGLPSSEITPALFDLTVTGYTPSVDITDNKSFTPNLFAMTLAGSTPSVDPASEVDTPAAFVLTVTGGTPNVALETVAERQPSPFTISIVGNIPSVAQTTSENKAPDTFALTLSWTAPSVEHTTTEDKSPTTFSLTLSWTAPTVELTTAADRIPAKFDITVTWFTAAVEQTTSEDEHPNAFALSVTGYSPTVDLATSGEFIAAKFDLTFAGYTSQVDQTTSENKSSDKFDLSLQFTTPVVSVTDNRVVESSSFTLTIGGTVPAVNRTASVWIEPTALNLSFAFYAPGVTSGDSKWISIVEFNLAITGHQPAIELSTNRNIESASFTLSLSFTTPQVGHTEYVEFDVTGFNLIVTGSQPAALVSDNQQIEVEAATLSIIGSVPSVGLTHHQYGVPSSFVLLLQGQVPSIEQTTTEDLTSAVFSLLLTFYQPSVEQTTSEEFSPVAASLNITWFVPAIVRTTGTVIPPYFNSSLAFTAPIALVTGKVKQTIDGFNLFMTWGTNHVNNTSIAAAVPDYRTFKPAIDNRELVPCKEIRTFEPK